ncbi:MAG: hypothetical protein Rhob2KO_12980 [Rhodopirellula baltica]|uniref:Uncharacterized protein n=1 Tax=Rhodopirellula baltica (strain DSM 10527 / NCIMB 13988 / SH1) TaxID=243090 RepID=Q7UN45_RHOBA|nr:hypothetical protein RB7790 [Rhodopirellula baltica SH 1]
MLGRNPRGPFRVLCSAVVGSDPNTHNQSRRDGSRKPWAFNPRSSVDPQAPKSVSIHRPFRIDKILFASASFGLGPCPSVLEELNDENNT